MHCLLLGNGINRLSGQIDWSGLLKQVGSQIQLNKRDLPNLSNGLPFSLYFEELCSIESKDLTSNEIKIKKKIAARFEDVEINSLHRQYLDKFAS